MSKYYENFSVATWGCKYLDSAAKLSLACLELGPKTTKEIHTMLLPVIRKASTTEAFANMSPQKPF